MSVIHVLFSQLSVSHVHVEINTTELNAEIKWNKYQLNNKFKCMYTANMNKIKDPRNEKRQQQKYAINKRNEKIKM